MVVFFRSQDRFDVIAEASGDSLKDARQFGDDGMNPIRALINAVPMILAWLFRRKLVWENDSVINLCINMSVIAMGVSLIAVVTSGIMVGRMPIYTS